MHLKVDLKQSNQSTKPAKRYSLAREIFAQPKVTIDLKAEDPLEKIKEIKQLQISLLSTHEEKARMRSLTMQRTRTFSK